MIKNLIHVIFRVPTRSPVVYGNCAESACILHGIIVSQVASSHKA